MIPMIYDVKEDPNNKKQFYLEPKIDLFVLPDKVYGGLDKYGVRFWKTFAISRGSMGILLTGASGSGKTTLSMIISNIAINNNMSVVLVSDIQANIDLVRFIDSLTNVVVVFDEFGKSFNLSLQDKMLTMFSNLKNSRKLFIITENDTRDISRYIRNRPGRVRYHLDFTRITEADLAEYCGDFPISMQLYNDLKDLHKKSTVFSIDHLIAIVSEHLNYPNDSLEELLGLLNLDILTKEEILSVVEARDLETDEVMEFRSANTIEKKKFENGRWLWLHPIKGESLKLNTDTVDSIEGDSYVCLVNKRYRVVLDVI